MDMRIEAAEMLGKCEGMGNAPCYLAKTYKKEIISCVFKPNGQDVVDILGNSYAFLDATILGKWLRIEDGNPWSSAAILARAGSGEPVYELANDTWWLGDYVLDVKGQAMRETANILGICKLYEIDRDAYYKGMRPLMDEELQGIKVERPVNL